MFAKHEWEKRGFLFGNISVWLVFDVTKTDAKKKRRKLTETETWNSLSLKKIIWRWFWASRFFIRQFLAAKKDTVRSATEMMQRTKHTQNWGAFRPTSTLSIKFELWNCPMTGLSWCGQLNRINSNCLWCNASACVWVYFALSFDNHEHHFAKCAVNKTSAKVKTRNVLSTEFSILPKPRKRREKKIIMKSVRRNFECENCFVAVGIPSFWFGVRCNCNFHSSTTRNGELLSQLVNGEHCRLSSLM